MADLDLNDDTPTQLDQDESNSLTLFGLTATETDKTDKTDLIDNQGFMQEVFGPDQTGRLPIVVSFPGNPSDVSGSSWAGSPWKNDPDAADNLPEPNNNYFSLAIFRPDDAGRYRRQKARFAGLSAVMLDDLGSKVPLERLTLKPSWLLETSDGNYQAGYLLTDPITDGPTADRLMNAVIEAELCDPGASGPRSRLARLPVAVNGKHSPPFRCRMRLWDPELRYTPEELVEGLQLEMRETRRSRSSKSTSAREGAKADDPVLIPRPEENVIIAALRERGLYKAPLGEGKHDITCPWVDDHTNAVDGGTAYFEPDDNWPIGGFKCLHGHCADRNIRNLLLHLEVEINAARMKPTIRVVAGEIHRVVDAAEQELSQARRYYQRGGLIVTVATDPGTKETRVQEISQPALVRAMSGAATWERFDARAGCWVRIDPPARHATVLFDATGYPHLPVLNGLARQPYLRPDGSLMTSAGYDSFTGMFGVFDARSFTIPDKPSKASALSALSLLNDLLSEFQFAADTDKAAALVAILTAAVRPSLSHAPMFHVKAHVVGSGKSYLCELITVFGTPQRGTPTTFPREDEECRKLLLAELLRAPAIIEFDNLTSDLLAHKSLCTALTSEHISGRILGVSKTATVTTRTLFLSSGNNVGPIQDMTRRCITINIDPGVEVPAARTFKRPDLVREVQKERGRYVSAALTIVRAWILAGRPKSECKSLASYGDWSDLCRQPLMWLGCADPTASVFEAMAEDPDRETLGRLLTAWYAEFGMAPTMVRDAVKRSQQWDHASTMSRGELKEVLHDIADERGEINRRRLGWWIRRHAGRIVDGLRFVRSSATLSAEAWRAESVLSVSSVSAGEYAKSVTDTDSQTAGQED